LDRSMTSPEKKIIEKYIFTDCKIVNLGKITVHYTGGNTKDGKITYSYSFSTQYEDTSALHAFRETYPKVYNSSNNDIYSFKNQ
jgi:hypothetical protein